MALFYFFTMYLFIDLICPWRGAHMSQGMPVEDIGKTVGIISFLPLSGFRGINSGAQVLCLCLLHHHAGRGRESQEVCSFGVDVKRPQSLKV